MSYGDSIALPNVYVPARAYTQASIVPVPSSADPSPAAPVSSAAVSSALEPAGPGLVAPALRQLFSTSSATVLPADGGEPIGPVGDVFPQGPSAPSELPIALPEPAVQPPASFVVPARSPHEARPAPLGRPGSDEALRRSRPATRGPDGGIPAPPGDGAIELGPLRLHTYGMLLAGGAAAGTAIFLNRVKAAGLDSSRAARIVAPTIVAGIVGARLYHVASEPGRYLDKPADVVRIWNGGLGIYGGVGLAALTGSVLARRAGLPVPRLLDAAVPALLVGQAIGRLGNYANQELYGKPTSLPWGLQVDAEHRPAEHADRNSFHPTFLYEGLANLALAGGLVAAKAKLPQLKAGTLFAAYLAGYGAIRFGVESLRIDDAHTWAGMRQNQWTSLGLVGAAGTAAVLLQRR